MSTQETGVTKTDAAGTAAQLPATRFTQKVIANFQANNGDLKLTNFQNKLIQSYFIKLDSILKTNEAKRLGKKPEYQEKIPFTWQYVNMDKLAQDVVPFAHIGLDPLQKNHINLICYANSKSGLYDIGFIIGYRGAEIKAMKYGFNPPSNVVVKVVFENDKFTPFVKDRNNPTENYEFEIVKPFERGKIVGGFYFHEFDGMPSKNVLEIFSLADIEKRKPKGASAEFWGGTKPVYVDGKKTNKTEVVEGWFEEMVWKTLFRAAYDDITIDSEKIDEHLVKMLAVENAEFEPAPTSQEETQTEINKKANKKDFDFSAAEEVKPEEEQPKTEEQPEPTKNDKKVKPAADPEPEKVDTLRTVGEELQQQQQQPGEEEPGEAETGVKMSFGAGGLFDE